MNAWLVAHVEDARGGAAGSAVEPPVDLAAVRELCHHVVGGWFAPSAAIVPSAAVAARAEVPLVRHTTVCVNFVDAEVMAELNEEHMGGDGPTDVLAFPIDSAAEIADVRLAGPALLGDVIVCPAAAGGQSVELLVTHGLLHLLGMDHRTPAEERAMFGRQEALVASFRAASVRAKSCALASGGVT